MHRLIISLSLFATLVACNKIESSVHVGLISWPGYESLVVAQANNLYDNVNVKISRLPNNNDVTLAFENNLVDVAALTINAATEMQSRSNEPILIIMILDISSGGDVIIADKNIKSITDLKNKRLGMEPSSLGAFFVAKAIESKQGISLNQIDIVPVSIENHYKIYTDNKVDAIATFEPQKSRILKQKGHVIFDSSQIPNQIFDVLITKESYAKKNPQALTELINGHFKAINLLRTQEKKTISEMASYEKISAIDFKNALSGIHIPTKNENIQLLKTNNPGIKPTIVLMHEFLKEKRIITNNSHALPQPTNEFISVSNK